MCPLGIRKSSSKEKRKNIFPRKWFRLSRQRLQFKFLVIIQFRSGFLFPGNMFCHWKMHVRYMMYAVSLVIISVSGILAMLSHALGHIVRILVTCTDDPQRRRRRKFVQVEQTRLFSSWYIVSRNLYSWDKPSRKILWNLTINFYVYSWNSNSIEGDIQIKLRILKKWNLNKVCWR